MIEAHVQAAKEAMAPDVRADYPQTAAAGELWSFVSAFGLALFYLATSIYIASHRLLWIDEIVTVYVARVPHWATIWTALGHAMDSLPPGYYMVVRLFESLFGRNQIGARLPSALAMAAGLLITFDCARRLTNGLYGLVAFSLLPCSFLPYFGYEARPYAIYFMFSALALWIWTCTQPDNKRGAILFGITLCLAVTIHYYAVLILVPYVVWEFYRWRPVRPLSAKLTAGILGAVVPAVVLSPLILSFAHRFAANFWARPSLFAPRWVYSELFPDGLLLLALAMLWIVLRPSLEAHPEPPQSAESIGWLFLCVPLVGFALAEVKTHAFLARYFICVLPGVAVALACWMGRNFRNNYRVPVGILLLLVAMGAAKQLQAARHPEAIAPVQPQAKVRQYLRLEDALVKDGRKFIVFSNSWVFLESRYYSRHAEECVFLLDATPTSSSSLGVNLAIGLAEYYPLHFWRLDKLKEHARDAALIEPSPGTVEALQQAGFQMQTRFDKPLEVVYPE